MVALLGAAWQPMRVDNALAYGVFLFRESRHLQRPSNPGVTANMTKWSAYGHVLVPFLYLLFRSGRD